MLLSQIHDTVHSRKNFWIQDSSISALPRQVCPGNIFRQPIMIREIVSAGRLCVSSRTSRPPFIIISAGPSWPGDSYGYELFGVIANDVPAMSKWRDEMMYCIMVGDVSQERALYHDGENGWWSKILLVDDDKIVQALTDLFGPIQRILPAVGVSSIRLPAALRLGIVSASNADQYALVLLDMSLEGYARPGSLPSHSVDGLFHADSRHDQLQSEPVSRAAGGYWRAGACL